MNTLAKKRNKLNDSLIRISASRIEVVCLLLVHTLAIMSVLLADLSIWIQQLLIVVLCTSAGVACHRWRGQKVKRLIYNSGRWLFVDDESPVDQYPSSVVLEQCYYWSKYLLVFVVSTGKPRRFTRDYRLIFYDACNWRDFHQLKLIARFSLRVDG